MFLLKIDFTQHSFTVILTENLFLCIKLYVLWELILLENIKWNERLIESGVGNIVWECYCIKLTVNLGYKGFFSMDLINFLNISTIGQICEESKFISSSSVCSILWINV